MAQSKKQDITIGSGRTKPIPAGNAPMVAGSKPSPQPTSIEETSTKPVSIPEALSMLQTLGVDLRGLNCEVSILAKGKMVYFVAKVPASIGELSMLRGHICENGLPVSNIVVKSSHNTAGQEPHIPK